MEKFGAKLGVTKVAISNIEKGNRNLTEQMALAICREYNVNYDWLMNGKKDMFVELPQNALDELCVQHELDTIDRALIDAYIHMSTDCRAEIKRAIKHISSI